MIKQAIDDNKILNKFLIQSCHAIDIPEESFQEITYKSDQFLQTPIQFYQKKVKKQLHKCEMSKAQIYYLLRRYSHQDLNEKQIEDLCKKQIRKAKSFEDLLPQKNNQVAEVTLVKFDDDSDGTEVKGDIQDYKEQQYEQQQGDTLIDLEGLSQQKEQQIQEVEGFELNGISPVHLQENELSQASHFSISISGVLAVCAICRSSSAYEEILKLLECEHKFCKYCYKEYLEEKIKIAKISNIPCPEEGCVQKFTEAIIEQIVSQERFNQYLAFKRKQEVENDPNKKWCPAIGCDKYVTKDPKTSIVKCDCGTIICFDCGKIEHPGLLCEQVIETDFILAISKYKMKYCPNCKSHIEKNAGCNHMTCIKCSFQFCWVCLQPYHQYHYRYWSIKGCAIWSNGRFKTSKVIANPDKMRQIYYLPRLILYILRGPLIIVKLTLNAAGKAFFTPLRKMNKKMIKGKKPKSCICTAFYILIMELIIIILVIILFPFIFLFYRIPKEIQWINIKGCAY